MRAGHCGSATPQEPDPSFGARGSACSSGGRAGEWGCDAAAGRDAEPAGWAFRPGHTSPEPPPTRGQAEAGACGRARRAPGRQGRVSLLRQVRPAGPPPSFRAPSGTALATFPAALTGTTATLGRKPEWIFQRRRRRRDTHRVGIVAVPGG